MDVHYHFAGLRRWLAHVRKHGRPHHLFYFDGGIGDQLMCSAVAREIQRRRTRRIWLFSHTPELFASNPDVAAVLPFDIGLIPWARLSGSYPKRLYYQEYLESEGRDSLLLEPSIAALCRRAGLRGPVTLRPYLPAITPAPLPARKRPRIAIHSSCLAARYPIANKQWPVERMQQVALEISSWADLVQIGSPHDPVLPGTRDGRGGSLLNAARELAGCDLFVGLVGFLMHLARAVDCPAVIIYGGREPPEITGYACNTNLAHRPECAPCWHYSQCGHNRRCLTAITPAQVVAAVRRQLALQLPRPLAAELFEIAA